MQYHQPQSGARLNNSNPIAKKLIHLWATFGGALNIYDTAGYAHGVLDSAAVTWASTPHGYALSVNVSESTSIPILVGDSNGSGAPEGTDFTIYARIYLAAAAGNSSALYTSVSSAGVEFRINADGTLTLLKNSVAEIGVSTSSIQFNAWCNIAVSYDGTTANFYIDGVAAGSSTSSQTFTHNQQYSILGSNVNSERLLAGSYVSCIGVARTILNIDEIKSLAGNPWQVFADRKLILQAPASITFNPAWALQSNQIIQSGAQL